LQYDQEQLNLRAKISEVEAEERVYQMFEERDGLSDRISAVRGSVEKSPLNPNAAEWPTCMSGNLKNAVSGAQTRGASVERRGLVSKLNMLMSKGMVRTPLHKEKNSMLVQIPQSVMSHASFR